MYKEKTLPTCFGWIFVLGSEKRSNRIFEKTSDTPFIRIGFTFSIKNNYPIPELGLENYGVFITSLSLYFIANPFKKFLA